MGQSVCQITSHINYCQICFSLQITDKQKAVITKHKADQLQQNREKNIEHTLTEKARC